MFITQDAIERLYRELLSAVEPAGPAKQTTKTVELFLSGRHVAHQLDFIRTQGGVLLVPKKKFGFNGSMLVLRCPLDGLLHADPSTNQEVCLDSLGHLASTTMAIWAFARYVAELDMGAKPTCTPVLVLEQSASSPALNQVDVLVRELKKAKLNMRKYKHHAVYALQPLSHPYYSERTGFFCRYGEMSVTGFDVEVKVMFNPSYYLGQSRVPVGLATSSLAAVDLVAEMRSFLVNQLGLERDSAEGVDYSDDYRLFLSNLRVGPTACGAVPSGASVFNLRLECHTSSHRDTALLALEWFKSEFGLTHGLGRKYPYVVLSFKTFPYFNPLHLSDAGCYKRLLDSARQAGWYGGKFLRDSFLPFACSLQRYRDLQLPVTAGIVATGRVERIGHPDFKVGFDTVKQGAEIYARLLGFQL